MNTPQSSRRDIRTPGGRRSHRLLRPLLWSGLIALGTAAMTVPAGAQQTGRIVGRVTDASTGAPIGEVQVFLPGTGLGSLSRQNGTFIILEVPAGTHELRAERIGLEGVSRQVTVQPGEALEVNLELSTQALGLDEIVVTGTAGASRRREVGNTISQINISEIPDRAAQVGDLLQGAAAGLNVGSVDGGVGQGQRFVLRGNSSVSMSNQPIIYIDGVRMQSEPNHRATSPDNRGNRGPNLTNSPINNINPNDIERIEIIKGAAATTLYGTEASSGVIQIFTKRGSAGAPVWTVETQQGAAWSREFGPESHPYMRMDPWLRTGYNHQYSASVRGGGETLQYFVSGQFSSEEGILPLDEGEKWTTRANFTFTPAEGLQLQWNSSYTNYDIQSTPVGSSAEGLTLNAIRGERNYFGSQDVDVISRVLLWDMDTALEGFTSGGTITYSPLANLTNRLTVGYDYSSQFLNSLRPVGHFFWPDGALHVNEWQNRLLTFDYVGTYSFDVTNAVSSSFSWGGQAVGEETRMLEGWGVNFPGAANPTINSAAQTQSFQEREKVWNAGFFLQNVLDVADRYFLTLGLRVDGNSAFGEGFGLQMYPKASASWVISDESWWSEGMGQVKLRAAYGQAGRAPGAFDAVRTWQGAGWLGQPAFVPRNVGNPDLGPEVTEEIEAGFDASWLGGRLSAAFTYYDQRTSEALFEVQQIPTVGFGGTQLLNVGKIQNTGVELTMDAALIQGRDLSWDLGMNLSTNHSKALDLGGAPPFSMGNNGWIIEGEPVPVMRGTLVTNADEIADPVDERNHLFGPNQPTLIVSPNTTLRLPGGVILSARGEYQGGHYMYTFVPIGGISRSARMPSCFPYYSNPQTSIVLRDDTPALWRARCTPRLARGDHFIYPADFFRLRTVSAQLPMDFLVPERISSAMLTLSLNNSWTWLNDEWGVMDPEMADNGGAHTQVQSPGYRVPTPITFRAAVQLQF